MISFSTLTGFSPAAATRPEGARPALVGYGKSFASFGELIQGRRGGGEDFLITLPIDLWSTCTVRCTPISGPLVIECDYAKSAAVADLVLERIGVTQGFHIGIEFTRNIPIGKGLSSSTADMLATLRALQEVFGVLIEPTFVSRVFHGIEPHDGIQYNSCVVYNHRGGYLIEDYGHIPAFRLLALDRGGAVDTVEYNLKLNFTEDDLRAFDELLDVMGRRFRDRDEAGIAACATRSAEIHARRTGNAFLKGVVERFRDFGAIGVVATHSGTCAGLVYPATTPAEMLRQHANQLTQAFGGELLQTRTLTILK